MLISLLIFSFYSAKNVKCQEATIQDALDFGASNFSYNDEYLDENFWVTEEIDDDGNTVGGEYMRQYCKRSFEIISADYCAIKYKRNVSCTTKLYYCCDDDTTIHSIFKNISEDTVTITFGNIAYIVDYNSFIQFDTYNNMNLIEEKITSTKTRSRKENDLLQFLSESKKDQYVKLKKYIKKNNLTLNKFPEHESKNILSKSTSIYNTKNMLKRLEEAFTFLQKNCGAPKEKF